MAKQNENDMTFPIIVVVAIMIAVLIWAIEKYAHVILLPWKYIRLIELAPTFQFDLIKKVLNAEFLKYDDKFEYVNNAVWSYYKWLSVPLVYVAFKMLQKVNHGWTMEDHLQVLYSRFQWLHITMKLPKGITFHKKFPFIKMQLQPEYTNISFPEGVEPLEYIEKHRDSLSEKLKEQLGPIIKIKDKQIEWKDQNAYTIAMTCYKLIPDKRPTKDAKSWREQAWQRCVQNHRYERTFALGMLEEARGFGVLSSAEMLWLRKQAGEDMAKGNEQTFYFWRSIVSIGGRCVYPESSGLICHYYFEKSLTNYLTTHKNDVQVAHYLRARPWIKNALNSFYDVENTVQNSPDVIALKKAGMYEGKS